MSVAAESTVLGLSAGAASERWAQAEDDLGDFALATATRGEIRLATFEQAADALWMARRLLAAGPDGAGPDGAREQWLALAITRGRVLERDGELLGRAVDECLGLLERARVGQILTTSSLGALAGHQAVATPLTGAAFEAGEEIVELDLNGRASSAGALPRSLAAIERHAAFCGRERDLHALQHAWESTIASGERRVAILSGEPGAGKTRLLARLASSLAARGAPVFYGRCAEESDAALAPIAEAFRELTPEPAGLALALPGGGEEDQRGAAAISSAPANLVAGQRGELELRAEVAAALSVAAEVAPVLLLVDDLHWVDDETLQLLLHLFDREEPIRGLAVVAMRDDEIEDGGSLGLALQRVRRRPGTLERRLEGLERSDLTPLTRSFLGPDRDAEEPRVTDAIHVESAGNPLFATELLRTLSDSGALGGVSQGVAGIAGLRLPATITETIRQRIERLGPDAAEALTVAGLCGVEFDLEVLGATLGWPEPRTEAALLAAERAGLLRERRGGSMGFSHALVVRALAERSGSAAQARIHRRIGEVIERLPERRSGEQVERLARHWLAAYPPDPERAIGYAHRAAARALAGSRASAALELYGAALRLHGEREDARRCELLLGLGLARQLAGRAEFRETLLEAARLAERLGDISLLQAAVIANHRGFVSASGAVDPERIAMLEVAADSTAESDVAYPHLLATLAAELSFSGEERRFALSDRALERARNLGDEATLAAVLVSRFVTTWVPETLPERLSDSAESVEIALRLDDPLLQFKAVHWHSVALIQAGEVALGAEMIERENRLANHYGDPVSLWIGRYDRANMAILSGRLDEAERLAGEALELGTSSSQPDAFSFYGSQLANVRYEQGRLAELQELLSQVVAENPGIPAFRSVLALACVEAELPEQAGELLAIDAAEGFELIPRDVTWLAGHTIYAHVSAALGDRDSAAALYERLEPHAEQIVYTGISAWGDVCHALARLASVLGRAEAEDLFERSCARYEAIGAPIWLARARLDSARMKLERGGRTDRAAALELLELAIIDARHLGATAIERRALALRENTRAAAAHGAVAGRSSSAARNGARSPGFGSRRNPSITLAAGVWEIEHEGRVAQATDSIGISYLAELLANPGVELHASELQAGVARPIRPVGVAIEGPIGASGVSGEQAVLDGVAKRAYRERIGELRSDLEVAERFNDPERAGRCREELELVARELGAALGLGGRDRALSSTAERARLNVTRAIRRAIAKIAESDSELGVELDRSIRTGTFCSYQPASPELRWDVRRKVAR